MALRPQALGRAPASGAPSVSGLNNGDLLLKDVSREDDGLYQCTVANHVGYSVCVVEVKVSGGCSGAPGTRRAGLCLEPTGSACPWPSVCKALPGGGREAPERNTHLRGNFLAGCPRALSPPGIPALLPAEDLH